MNGIHEVVGSIPISSTMNPKGLGRSPNPFCLGHETVIASGAKQSLYMRLPRRHAEA